MNTLPNIEYLIEMVKELYLDKKDDVPFHGWHHICFVLKKATEFARELGADVFFVQAAALTHDLNYLVQVNSKPEVGKALRKDILLKSGFTDEQCERIEIIINEAHIANRKNNDNISREGMALSDADTLYKALPVTPILFSSNYMIENKISIEELANKVLSEQKLLREKQIYFYSTTALQHLKWADINLALWENVLEAIQDDDVKKMLQSAGINI